MILDVIKNLHDKQKNLKWYETFWVFDLHGTIIKPSRIKDETKLDYYPYAKECLQILTRRHDVYLIIHSSTSVENLEKYKASFVKDDIFFNFTSENPNISAERGHFGYYERKFYFDVMFDDKAGFFPEKEWEQVYNYLTSKENFKPPDIWKLSTKTK